jgi:hypothetical protein
MTPESLKRFGRHIPAEVNQHNRRAVFSVVDAARVATQWCAKHASEAVNQRATL